MIPILVSCSVLSFEKISEVWSKLYRADVSRNEQDTACQTDMTDFFEHA